MDANSERIKAARTLVAAPLLVTLASNVGGSSSDKRADLVHKTIDQAWAHPGEIVISDAVLHPYILHLRMSKVPKNYRFEIAIPPGYEKSLREKFALFRAAVRSFWDEWRANNDHIMTVCHLPEHMEETETAFHWRNDDEFWVGIMGYFTDSCGKRYIVDRDH